MRTHGTDKVVGSKPKSRISGDARTGLNMQTGGNIKNWQIFAERTGKYLFIYLENNTLQKMNP